MTSPAPALSGAHLQSSLAPDTAPCDVAQGALTRYLAALVKVSTSLQERQHEALQAYLEDAGKAIANSQSDARLKESGELPTEVEPGANPAWQSYLQDVDAAWREAQAECRLAYDLFASEIKKMFSDLSTETLTPACLSTIAQALATAAVYANISQQSMTVVEAGKSGQN